jgi:hypothetical protein
MLYAQQLQQSRFSETKQPPSAWQGGMTCEMLQRAKQVLKYLALPGLLHKPQFSLEPLLLSSTNS